MALEPRLMFDGAAVVDADAALSEAQEAPIPAAPAPTQVREADPSQNNGKKDVVFIDTSVAGYKDLEATVNAGVEIQEISGGASGLAQIAAWAETHSGYDSISLISHGTSGAVQIGAATLADPLLADPVVQAQLAAIGHSLNAGGDLLLYGCDIAQGAGGRQFVDNLAAATGADVAASTDTTGAASDGRNWTLEYATGRIDADGVDGESWHGDLGWIGLGGAGFTSNGALSETLAVAPDGTLYLAYADYIDSSTVKATVKKYSSADGWTTVGDADFVSLTKGAENHSSFYGYFLSLEIAPDGTPYVAYRGTDYTARVMKYDGSAWVAVGGAVSEVYADYESLAITPDGTIYVAFRDYQQYTGAYVGATTTVMKYSNGAWTPAGTPGFTYQPGDYTNGTMSQTLAVDPDGNLYLAYLKVNPTYSIYVHKYSPETNTWTTVGDTTAVTTALNQGLSMSMAFAADGTPYLSYDFTWGVNGQSVGVMRYAYGDITSWDDDYNEIVTQGYRWEAVGTGVQAGSSYGSVQVAPDGTVYCAYTDLGMPGYTLLKAGVKAYDPVANTWVSVGPAGLSAGNAAHTSLAVGADGGVYLAYEDFSATAASGYGKATVISWVTAPQATSSNRVDAQTTKGSDGLDYTVTFNQEVAGVDASDFAVTKGAGVTGTPTISVTAVSATTYTVHVAGLSGDGTVRLDLNSSGTGIAAVSGGVAIAGGYASGQTYTLDNTAPAISGVTLNSSTYKIGQTITATITVASDADTYTLGSLSIAGHTFTGLTKVNATTYTATYTVQDGDTDLFAGSPAVSAVLADGAGNSNTAYTTAVTGPVTIDGHGPTDITLTGGTVTTAAGANATVGTLGTADTTSGDTFTYTLVAGTGGTNNASFDIDGNALRVGDPAALGAGTYGVRVRTTDAVGNWFEEAFSVTVSTNAAPTNG
ncbi:MAG: DUF4347 domain-containing protein, partial [Alphaproteobacteria bacterium]|nr:DUF4347 domain-containing protein [Alphaproteobacteria bacterium]